MKLTVLIAAYDRKSLLERYLLHLVYRARELPDEVVVVAGGRDGSEEIIRKQKQSYPFIKLVEVENKSLGDSHYRREN